MRGYFETVPAPAARWNKCRVCRFPRTGRLSSGSKGLGDCLAGQRVQHDVDTFAIGGRQRLLCKRKASGIHGLGGAELSKVAPFRFTPGGCQHGYSAQFLPFAWPPVPHRR